MKRQNDTPTSEEKQSKSTRYTDNSKLDSNIEREDGRKRGRQREAEKEQQQQC